MPSNTLPIPRSLAAASRGLKPDARPREDGMRGAWRRVWGDWGRERDPFPRPPSTRTADFLRQNIAASGFSLQFSTSLPRPGRAAVEGVWKRGVAGVCHLAV